MTALTLNLDTIVQLTDDAFYALCRTNPEIQFERTAKGELIDLTPEQRRRFPPIAPDFVVELRSDTDSLTVTQAKMQEYIDNGVRLGWLLDPQARQVEIYREGQDQEVLSSPTNLSGEEILPRFVLDLRGIL